jgi:protein-disulfide isomerase
MAWLLLFAAALLCAQDDWRSAAALPGLDLSGLTPAQRATVMRLLRNHNCSCGCGMKVAECRIKDPNCSYSKGLSAVMIASIRQGKGESEAVAAANTSRWGHTPAPPKLLDDPVAIPIAGAPTLGPENARITLVEFSDFQCPYCMKAMAQLNAVLKAYPSQVRLVFKQFPLDSHSQAATAAAAALAAERQGKFWPMHDALFANRERLSRQTILNVAAGLNLDMKRFTADLESADIRHAVARDLQDGDRAGVEATPTVFIDGKRYNGMLDLESLRPILDAELKTRAKAR